MIQVGPLFPYSKSVEAIVKLLNEVVSDGRNCNDSVSSYLDLFILKSSQMFTVDKYVERLVTLTRMEGSTFIHTLILVDRFLEKSQSSLTSRTFHKIFFVGIVIAIKYNEDCHFHDRVFCQIGGFRLQVFRKLESLFLETINYRLHIKEEVYRTYFNFLDRLVKEGETYARL